MFSDYVAVSGVSEYPEDNTVMEKHGTEALYCALESVMHAIGTEDEHAQHDVAHRIIPIATPWTIWRWSVLNGAKGKPLVPIPKVNAHLDDLKWTDEGQVKLKALVERYTSPGASVAWRVLRWWLVCI